MMPLFISMQILAYVFWESFFNQFGVSMEKREEDRPHNFMDDEHFKLNDSQ